MGGLSLPVHMVEQQQEEDDKEPESRLEGGVLMTFFEGKFISMRLPNKYDEFHAAKPEHWTFKDKILNNIYPISKLLV